MNFVTSKYLQICDWALIEYEYSTMSPKFLQYPTVGNDSIGIYRMTNNATGEYHFMNKSDVIDEEHKTGNSLDWNLIPITPTKSKWATSNVINNATINPPSNPLFVVEDKSSSINDNVVMYDTIRIHVLSGYNFEGIDGFVLNVAFMENSKKKMQVSCSYYPKDGTYVNGDSISPTFNPNPIVISERTYDKYITIAIPSLYQIQQEASLHPGNNTLFSKLYTHPSIPDNPNPGGFVKDSTIYLSLYEIISDEEKDSIEYFTLKNVWDATILTSDVYSALACTVKESELGDYYEYYPTWAGEFINEYISLLNANNGNGENWSVIHNIKVIEQIGTEFFTTTDMTIPQSNNFDEPSYFRPIILYADSAYAYSILYTMHLANGSTGEHVMRVCNVTSYDPKKYGRSSKRIQIDEGISPMKVYNKVVNLQTMPSNQMIRSNNMFTVKYVPMYMNQNTIAVNMTNSTAPQLDSIIYGQGKCVIQLTPFDNIIKFYVQNVIKTGTAPMNLSGSNVFLKFIMDDDSIMTIAPTLTEDAQQQNGELIFHILKDNALKLLKVKKDKSFYIISKQENSSLETVIYKGKFEKYTEGIEIDKEIVKPLTMKLSEEQEKLNAAIAENDSLKVELEKSVSNNELLAKEMKAKIAEYNKIIQSLSTSSTTTVTTPQPAENVTSNNNTAVVNPVKYIVPKSQKPQQQQANISNLLVDNESNILNAKSTSVVEKEKNKPTGKG